LNAEEFDFRTTDRHYADKWLRKRVFFCSSGEGNPEGALRGVAKLRLLFQKRARSSSTSISIITEADIVVPLSLQCCIGTVKIRARKNFAGGNPQRSTTAKKKKPGTAGLFDEFHFRSVHFASLAI
jgi:hypothetical protein